MPNHFRLATLCALIFALAAPMALAQDPNQNTNGPGGRNGGGPGGGWGGGRGGFGGPGGPGGGTSVSALIQMPAVQDELKLTDKQKDQVKQVVEAANKKRETVRQQADKMATQARQEAAEQAAAMAEANDQANAAAAAASNANNGANFGGFGASSNFGGFGGTNNGGGNAGGGPGGDIANNGGNNSNGGGRGGPGGGGRGGRGPDAGAIVSRQIMDAFQADVDAKLLKVLEPKQKTRIKQIALQAEGVGAFNNPEVVEKLAITPEQSDAIAGIRNESRQARGQLMGQFFQSIAAASNNNGDNANANANGGNNGGRGGRGNRPDPAAFQTPEAQAKMKTMQEQTQKLDDQAMANVGKALTKSQKAKFNMMIGEKFDVASLRRSFMDRFRPGGANGQPGAQASAATPPAATTTPPAATTPTAAGAAEAATPKATSARKSLRETRGGSTQP